MTAVGQRVVAFVEYTSSPEARYPVAIEQGCATAFLRAALGTV